MDKSFHSMYNKPESIYFVVLKNQAGIKFPVWLRNRLLSGGL